MKNAVWFVVAGTALGVAFLVQSPYMAFAIYAFLLLVTLAYFSSLAWLSGLDCERSISRTMLQPGRRGGRGGEGQQCAGLAHPVDFL